MIVKLNRQNRRDKSSLNKSKVRQIVINRQIEVRQIMFKVRQILTDILEWDNLKLDSLESAHVLRKKELQRISKGF